MSALSKVVLQGLGRPEAVCCAGLIYRMKDPKVVLLIFVSGKVVLTGSCRPSNTPTLLCSLLSTLSRPSAHLLDAEASQSKGGACAPCGDTCAERHAERFCRAGAKRREDLYMAFENIYPVLKQYRKGDAAPHKTRKTQNPARTLAVGFSSPLPTSH